MIEIWIEFGIFNGTNKKLADEVRTVIKNSWFSDFEIPEIHQKIYRQTHQQIFNTLTETINTAKRETSNPTLHDNESCTVISQTQKHTREEKTNAHTIKRILLEEKTILPSEKSPTDLMTHGIV